MVTELCTQSIKRHFTRKSGVMSINRLAERTENLSESTNYRYR